MELRGEIFATKRDVYMCVSTFGRGGQVANAQRLPTDIFDESTFN